MSKLSETPSENLAALGPALHLSPEFSLEQRRTLLRIAHQAILSVLEPRTVSEAAPFPTVLSEPRGVFTTLYVHRGVHGDVGGELPSELHSELQRESHRESDRELRGCVGYALPIVPLHRAVAETARAAAFEDSRFLPVTKEEALELEVALSVLSRLFPIHPAAVEVGRHGLLISDGVRRGLLLPQVPVEHGWDRETFLEQTCRKAGLRLDAWRKNTTIEAFTAEVFSDTDVEIPR
jgi:AmmeMemoRadiSam system protein A